MHLIIGGAYQGKLDYAKENYRFTSEDIFACTQEQIDFTKPCLTNIEEFTYGCILRDEDPVAVFVSRQDEWRNSVLIIDDISGGVVPMNKTDRTWRSTTGKLCQYLSREAEKVSRIFCGLEQRLK